jgi:RHS repeat-associated protein
MYGSTQGTMKFTEMYGYTQAGQPNAKMLQALQSTSTTPINLTASYTYDNEGKMASVTYPNSGGTFTYSFDSMYRLVGLTGPGSSTLVSNVTYNADNQILGITSSNFGNETRTYNSLNQLVGLSNANVNAGYNYTVGSDNGKVASANIGGETVTYQYDSLNRLISAAGSSGWGDSYGYDPFGNLLSKTVTAGSAPTLSINVNPGSNRLDGSGDTYDVNGNAATSPSGQTLGYDSENRVIEASVSGSSYVQYAYDLQNKRIFSSPYASSAQNAPVIYFYGVDGQQLGAFAGGTCTLETSFYLGSKRVGYTGSEFCGAYYTDPVPFGAPTEADRLGSNGTYYPWGEAKGSTNPADIWSFGTYWRDSFSGLDYANQRYYSNVQGRFMTPDPYQGSNGGSGTASNPQSWNRYAYALGDPANRIDSTGRYSCGPDDPNCNPGCDPSDPSCNPGCDPSDPSCIPAPPPNPGPKPEPRPPTPVPCSSTVDALAGALGGTAACDVGAGPAVELFTSLSDFDGFLQGVGLAPAAGTGGVLTVGGITIGWGEIAIGVLDPEVVISIAAIAGAVALYEYWQQKESITERLVRCNEEYFADLHKCAAAYPPGSAALKNCYAAAKQKYDQCRGIGIQ